MKLNNKTCHLVLLACFAAMSSACSTNGDKSGKGRIHLNFPTMRGSIPIKTWKELRDDKIVKQDRDDSCGAASVATILRSFYGLDVSEKDILDEMEKTGNDSIPSFSDLKQVVQSYGFKGKSMSLNYEKLKTLNMPAIAYLRYRGDDHFSVIRGISQDDIVWLGDPSWGNRKFTQYQFREMWETRKGERLKGKILLIVPKDAETAQIDQEFFRPPTVNRTAIELLTIRR